MNPEALLQRLAELRREGNMIMQQLEGMGLPRRQVVAMISQAEAPQGPPQGMPQGGPPQSMAMGPQGQMGAPSGLLGGGGPGYA